MRLSNKYALLADLPNEDPRTIYDIPVEILQKIFYWASSERKEAKQVYIMYEGSPRMGYATDPNEANPNDEHPVYKSLRQVSQAWNDIATPLLYHTMVLLSHPDSWEHLNNVALKPDLAQYVRVI